MTDSHESGISYVGMWSERPAGRITAWQRIKLAARVLFGDVRALGMKWDLGTYSGSTWTCSVCVRRGVGPTHKLIFQYRYDGGGGLVPLGSTVEEIR